MKSIILLGGGLDSTILMIWLKKIKKNDNLHAIFFNYNQKALDGEKSSVEYFCNKYNVPLKIIKLPIDEISNSAILKNNDINVDNDVSLNCLEGRNIIFLSIACTYSATIGADNIYLGYHIEPDDKPFPDATKEAIESFNKLIKNAYRNDVKIEIPFCEMERVNILKMGLDLDRDIIDKTFTCYENKNEHCGKCKHCLQKEEYLKKLCVE